MNSPADQLAETIAHSTAPRRELAAILEAYLADLERGERVDRDRLLAAHPEWADELRPYLDSLHKLHAATRDLRSLRGVPGETTGNGAKQIGDYRILREVGRGGMGVVYEAHQVSLNRRVALKILPFAAVLDERQIARFRNEAQAAAQLHHPNIVPVFAVGQENGVYYYAMQFIDGQSLEAAIDELRAATTAASDRSTRAHGARDGSTTTIVTGAASMLSTAGSIGTSAFFRSVARVGQQAAEAVHHAHQYGIIHRDVKPSNLLLDLQGKVWVTDFGLARIQNNSGVTLTGDVVGTLRYMSPEQACGQAGLVDSRTDVYSLGVTLYELLTLQHAFSGDDRHVVLRKVERDEPVAPRQLNPAIPVDLETIVLTAMAKSRDDRYATAQALADDLKRFLEGKPALARRPGILDRAGKWARRHRAVVALAAAAVAVVSVVSTIGLVMLAREQARTRAALRQADENFARAEQNFLQARDMLDQFGVRLADQLAMTPGTEPLQRQLLADTDRYYREFIAQAAGDPALRHEAALAEFKRAVIAAKLGHADEAVSNYARAARQLEALAAERPGDAQLAAQLALVHNNLAILAAARRDFDEARTRYERAIAMQSRLAAARPDDREIAAQLAESQSNLGMLLDAMGDAAAAELLLTKAVDRLRPLATRPNAEPRQVRNLSIAANNLSYVLAKRDPVAAERAAREAVALVERLAVEPTSGELYQADLALCYNNLAALLSRVGRVDEALDWHGRAATLQERLVRKAPAVVRHRSDLAVTLNNLGVAYCRAGRVDESDVPFGRARELFAILASDYPDELAYCSALAGLLNNQALALAGAGRHERAVALYDEAIQAQRRCYQQVPGSELMQDVLSRMVYNQARSLAALGRWDDAVAAAVARRALWPGNGERLFGVAVELAEIGRAAAGDAALGDRVNRETIATLRQACAAGFQNAASLAEDERFEHLYDDRAFQELVGGE